MCEDLNGIVTIVHHGKILDYTCHVRARPNPEIIDSKQIAPKIESIKHSRKSFKPASNHPWRHFVINPAKAAMSTIKQPKNALKMDIVIK